MASIADPSVSARTSGIRNRLDMNGTSYILPDDCVRGCVNGGKLTASVSRRQDVSSQGGYRGSSGQLGSRFERCVVCTGAAGRADVMRGSRDRIQSAGSICPALLRDGHTSFWVRGHCAFLNTDDVGVSTRSVPKPRSIVYLA